MEIIFLGTGAAWGLPEHGCFCRACQHLRSIDQSRTRTSLWLAGPAQVLIDPGPDLRAQIIRESLPPPDAVLITHEHGDHYLGLDELLCFRRNLPREKWRPLPVYASQEAWPQIERRFDYLLGSLLEKRLAIAGQPLSGEPFGPSFTCRPVKTIHGATAPGAVGYVFEVTHQGRMLRLGYTSDMTGPADPDAFAGLDLLVCQCHFFNEPAFNRPSHLSLQRALPLLKRWRPGQVCFVHLSCQDFLPGDEPANQMLKKLAPKEPMRDPQGRPYPVPLDQASWQGAVERVFADRGLPIPARVAFDGLRMKVGGPPS